MEPLHIKNNAWQYFFKGVLKEATAKSVVAREYFQANALFLPSSVNPTVWTIGHIIPSHAQDVHSKDWEL